jgi:hypothetical protein
MPTQTLTAPRRELARRSSGGIEVILYWSALDNCTTIEIRQPETDQTLTFAVSGDRALDAPGLRFVDMDPPFP